MTAEPRLARRSIAVLTLPNFNMMATTGFLDPFRAANYLSRDYRYDWAFIGLQGGTVTASNGMAISGTLALESFSRSVDLVVISASWTPEDFASPRLLSWLRWQERQGTMIGGIDTGAFIMGYGGLLDGHAAALHFEHHASFEEIFPYAMLSPSPYSIDRRRFSSAGGTAATDLGLALLSQLDQPSLASDAAEYLYHRSRIPQDQQNPPIDHTRLPKKLHDVIRQMEENRENVLAIEAFAARVRLSQRQLERLFKKHLQTTPVRYYLHLRLDYARRMVTQTSMPMIEIAVACGFTSQEHFSRSYRNLFGIAPSADRQVSRVPFQLRGSSDYVE